jgi:hypothetical protein
MTNVLSDELLMLLGEMRGLLEEILAADTNIAAVNFRVVYLSEDQVDRIRRAVAAGEPFSLSSPPPPV